MSTDQDFADYSPSFADLTPEQQRAMFDEINRDRKEMKMAPLASLADVTRKHMPATLAQIEATDTSARTRYATPGQVCGKGRVRKLSDAQIGYLNHLLANRNTSSLVRLPGSEDITYMSLKGASDLIDRLLDCPAKAGQPTERMATDKQVAYALSLTTQKMGAEKAAEVEATAKAMTAKQISTVIDALKAMPYPTAQPIAKTPEVHAEPVNLEGMHLYNGRIFKVQVAHHGSGNLYAKELIDGSFEYAPGVIRTLSAATKMTLDQAKEYGALYGVCCVCARTLTNEASIEAGIGPVCAGKF